MKKFLILIITLCLTACGLGTPNNSQVRKYGEKIFFADGKELKFPDFSIKFTGKHETTSSALKMTFYDFVVTENDRAQTVKWSSGTGDIAPTSFIVDGTDFLLELGQSDVIKGGLGEGNLVIWKKTDFDEAKKKQ